MLKQKHWWSNEPMFQDFTSAKDYEEAGITGYEPMTAKELDTTEKQDSCLNDPRYIIEEKFDGTRGLCYFLAQDEETGYCRMFSRRISKKTGFYVENTDSVPQIRDTNVADLNGTILDGEVFIPFHDFETSCGIMNSKYDRAITMQEELGFEVFHAFDILFYCGIDLRHLSLKRRKYFLHKAVREANNPYVKEVEYHNCGEEIPQRITDNWIKNSFNDSMRETYPNLYSDLEKSIPSSYAYDYIIGLSPRAYYEYVVATGGEGVMVKPKSGRYLHKRGWEYSKIKKFLTRELVIMGYEPPEKAYKGKKPYLDQWDYWEYTDEQGNTYTFDFTQHSRDILNDDVDTDNWVPVTKNYAQGLIGNLKLGVKISSEEYQQILPKNRGEYVDGYMQVCTCAGYTDEVREEISNHRDKYLGKVVEVKANEIFRNKGTLRHPRFLRFRPDKNPSECLWRDHIL